MEDRTCTIEGCTSPVKSRQMCGKHYQRLWACGDPLAVQESANCVDCGTELVKKSNGPIAHRCAGCKKSRRKEANARASERTKAKSRAENAARRAVSIKECPQCGGLFTPARSMAQTYCSKSCSRRNHLANVTKSCEVVECERPVSARGMCAMHWRRWARATGREKPQAWSPERLRRWQERQEQKRATRVEPVRNLDVFERDRWICGICGESVDSALTWPNPMCATLDHIVPLSAGGSHTHDNVQCAHARCNIAKGSAL